MASFKSNPNTTGPCLIGWNLSLLSARASLNHSSLNMALKMEYDATMAEEQKLALMQREFLNEQN